MNLPRKLRMIAASKKKGAPRWADLKAFNKKARTRRLPGPRKKRWRHYRLKL